MSIGRYTPSAVICLCIVLIAFGVSQLVEEGPNGSSIVLHRSAGWGNASDRWDAGSVQDLPGAEAPEGLDAYPSNVPSVPGWDGIRVPPGNDVPDVVEPTPAPTAQVGEVDVVPTGSDTSTSVPEIASPPDVTGIVCAHDWDCGMAVRIVGCETGGTFDPYAVGHEDERGWFQIRWNHWDKPQCDPAHLFDPAYNTACAYSLYSDSNTWAHWYSSAGCWN